MRMKVKFRNIEELTGKNIKEYIGRNAAICYKNDISKEYKNLKVYENISDTCVNNGHHSVMEHIVVNLELVDIPKTVAFVLNRMPVYSTSERSARYTNFENNLSDEDKARYNECKDIFLEILNLDERVTKLFDEKEITKKALENARYVLPIDVITNMYYSLNLREFCYLNHLIEYYTSNVEDDDNLIIKNMREFGEALKSSIVESFGEDSDFMDIVNRTKPNNNYLELKRNLFIMESHNFEDYYESGKGEFVKVTPVENSEIKIIETYMSFAVLNQFIRHRSIEILDIKEPNLDAPNMSYYIPLILSNVDGEMEYFAYSTIYENNYRKHSQCDLYRVKFLVKSDLELTQFLYSRLCSRALLEIENVAKRISKACNEIENGKFMTKPKCFTNIKYCTEHCKQRNDFDRLY